MMKSVVIQSMPGFEEWRQAARECLNNGVRPDEVFWQSGASAQHDLLADIVHPTDSTDKAHSTVPTVSGEFLQNAEAVACYSQPQRYDLLYRMLWV